MHKVAFLISCLGVFLGQGVRASILLGDLGDSNGSVAGDGIVGAQFFLGPSVPFTGVPLKLDESILSKCIGGTLRLQDGQTGTFDLDASNCPAFPFMVNRLTNALPDEIAFGGFGFTIGRKGFISGWAGGLDNNANLWKTSLYRSQIDRFRLIVSDVTIGKRPEGVWGVITHAHWQVYGTPLPRAAKARARVSNGFVVGIDIIDVGFGYTTAPGILFFGEGKTAAQASLDVKDGYVSSVTILNAGNGYGKAPTIQVIPPIAAPRAAFAFAEIQGGFVTNVRMVDEGLGYELPPKVLLVGGGGSGATAVAQMSFGQVVSIQISSAGSGYTSVPTVAFGAPNSRPELGITVSCVKVNGTLIPGRRYLLESSANLTDWIAEGEPFIAMSPDYEQEVKVAGTGRYFRITEHL